MVEIRPVELPADDAALDRLDTSLVTHVVYDVVMEAEGCRLLERRLPAPLHKRLPSVDTDGDRMWDTGFVVDGGAEIAGFVATGLSRWNRRLVVAHLYVAADQRRHGLGRALLDHAVTDGAARGAEIAWLEASNVNYPAITAYRRLGFYLCGLDTTLYAGTPAHDEVALFFARPLRQ